MLRVTVKKSEALFIHHAGETIHLRRNPAKTTRLQIAGTPTFTVAGRPVRGVTGAQPRVPWQKRPVRIHHRGETLLIYRGLKDNLLIDAPLTFEVQKAG